MRKFKNIIFFILLSALTLSFSITTLASNSVSVDYKTALTLALNYDQNTKLQDEKIKAADDRYYYYCNLAVQAKYEVGNNDSQQIEYRKQELLYPMQYNNNLTYVKKDKEDIVKNVKLDITNKYFSYFILNKQIELQTKVIENCKKELSVAKSKLKTGKITQTSMTEIDNALKQEQTKLDQLNRNKQISIMLLNSIIGSDLTQNVLITDKDIPGVEYKIVLTEDELKKMIEYNQTNDISVKKVKNQLEEAKLELKIITDNTNNKNYPGKEQLEDSITNSTYKLKSAQLDIESNIRQQYNNLLNLNDDVEINKLEVETSKKELDIISKKYKLGLIGYARWNEQITKVDNAEISLLNAKLNLYIQSLKFESYFVKTL